MSCKTEGHWESFWFTLKYFEKLSKLLAINKSNHRTVVDWTHKKNLDDSTIVFERVFWSFGSCIKGFMNYRSLINIDSTYLYKWYDRKLLIIVVFYANNKLFPMAFSIVDDNNNSNWGWFLLCL